MALPDIDWIQVIKSLLKVMGAFALALPVAWEREQSTRVMGLRTFPIVSVASCGFVLISQAFIGADANAQARILQGLMTGIGFIGGGAILKEGTTVRGTATAASIWTIGAVGAAVAHGSYEIALVISVLNFLMLRLLTPLKGNLNQKHEDE